MHDRRIIRQGAIAVEGKTIVEVGKTNDLRRKYRTGYEKIDAKDKVVIPGLINTHQHAAMSLLRVMQMIYRFKNGLKSGYGQSKAT